MSKTVKGYRVRIYYTVTYDPASEVPGLGRFYPDGHTDLVRQGEYWNEYKTGQTAEEATAAAKRELLNTLGRGRYQHGSVHVNYLACYPLYR